MSELQQEGIEHQLPNDYLPQVTPSVFNYGVEVQLPRVRRACLLSLMSIGVARILSGGAFFSRRPQRQSKYNSKSKQPSKNCPQNF